MTFTIINLILLFILIYALVLYPPLLVILAKLFKRELNPKDDYKPSITFLIAAYNEEKYIGGAIQSIIDSNYDKKKIQILVGSDGSTDRTVEIVKSFDGIFDNLQVVEVDRGGKNGVLNALYPKIQNEIIYILDADFRLSPDAISESIKFFADKNVGIVISKLLISNNDDKDNAGFAGENSYQKLDNFLKVKESEIWTTVNNFGCYGIRAEMIKPIPNNQVCDDMFNILSVATKKYRVIISNSSIVYEVREKSAAEEVNRRDRIVAGAYSTVRAVKAILNPFTGWASFFFISHKILKYLMPFNILLIVALTPFMYSENTTIFYAFAISEIVILVLALIGWFLDSKNIFIKLFSFPYLLLMINVGFFKGTMKFLQNNHSAMWERIDTVNKQ